MKVFVYGSNEQGIHGAGSAKEAKLHYGAVQGKTKRSGQSYGISTKRTPWETLPLEDIQKHVSSFLRHARKHLEDEFHVVPIGCGYAGYTPKEIAPMFRGYSSNVHLPKEFLKILRLEV